MKKLLIVLTLALGLTWLTAAGVEAHNATGNATCVDGAFIHADSYDPAQANTYDLKVVGVGHLSGTFTDATDQVIAIPQDGKVYQWSYDVTDPAGSYHFSDSGTVGPCGTPPPSAKKIAHVRVVPYCNGVRVEGHSGIASIDRVRHGDVVTFTFRTKKGWAFSDGSTVKVRRVHLKTTGCGHGSGS